jgi:plasmid stabilization system protein ParE
MPTRFSPGATWDVEKAIAWYEERHLEFAADFRVKLRSAIASIEEDPSRFPLDPDSPRSIYVRYSTLRRFPYKILFIAGDIGPFIVGVTHTSRHSNHWRRRLFDG